MSKEKLEAEKLNLEIKKLKQPWYRNIELWKIIIPTVAIVVSLYFTFGKGLLDSEKQKLEIQKEQLKLEILQFEKKRSDIIDSIALKDVERQQLINLINNYKNTKDSLTLSIRNLHSQTSVLKKENENIKSVYSKDKEFYKKEIKKRFKEGQTNLKELGRVKGVLEDNVVKEAGLNALIEYYKGKVNLTQIEKSELEIKRLSAESDELDKNIKRLEESRKKTLQNLEKSHKEIDTVSTDELMRRLDLEMIERDDK